MKKRILVLAALLTMASSAFAFSMGERFFEIKVNLPVNISNNGIGLNDVLKEEMVIDFPKIFDSIGEKDLELHLFTSPEIDLNLRFGKLFKLGFQTGVDTDFYVGLTNDTIALFARGNPNGEPLGAGVAVGGDVFAYTRVPFSFDVDKLELAFVPTLFVPVLHAQTKSAGGSIQNDSDGTFTVKASAEAVIYSAFASNIVNGGQFAFDSFDTATFMKSAGFDMGVSGKYPIIPNLKAKASLQCPIVPGKLASQTTVKYEMEMAKNLLDSSKNKEMTTVNEEPTTEAYNGRINRPLTFMAGVEYSLFKELIVVDGSVGFGVGNPFSGESTFYPQYEAKATVDFLKMIGCTLSTNYIKQVFAHSAAFKLNLRLVEVDAGISLSGTTLPASFAARGLGAFVAVSIGF